jgi:hypothetical protein
LQVDAPGVAICDGPRLQEPGDFVIFPYVGPHGGDGMHFAPTTRDYPGPKGRPNPVLVMSPITIAIALLAFAFVIGVAYVAVDERS